ncbi:bifunctional TVP38/TMEM64 family protein/FAD-dependent oxidoreductase [soil metagenome]
MSANVRKILVIFVLIAVVVAFYVFRLDRLLSLDELKSRQVELQASLDASPTQFLTVFSLVYVLVTGFSIPGATVLTLAAGFLFGFCRGLVVVSICSTAGATISFLMSRFFLSGFVARRFGDRMTKINKGFEKDGSSYLLTLRLVPLFPFFLVNVVMGLTPIRTFTFAIVSLVGMLPGTAAFVNAGTELSRIDSLQGLLSPGLIVSFTLVGLIPMAAKMIVVALKNRKLMKRFRKPKHFDYNLVVIGAGSGGLVSSFIASAVKAKVALIEKHKMGGDCLNTGCVPSKALIRSAKLASNFSRAREFGFDGSSLKPDFPLIMERIQNVIRKIEPHDSVERYEGLGVECFTGDAKIISPFEVEVGGKILTTKNIVIATGARPMIPPIPGLSEMKVLTSDNVWNLRKQPRRLAVLGGGPIGCELAQAFSRLGSEVTIIEMSDRILSREDEEVSRFAANVFSAEGIKVLTKHKAVKAGEKEGEKFLICENAGQQVRIEFDEILIALGRRANVTGFGLEELGVEVSKRGTIAVDDFMQTNFPGIYACGDVAGPYQFTHTAAHQAWYASVNALFRPFKKFAADYRVIPWCTFIDPEVARVGLSETEAKEKGIAYEVARYEISELDRAITEEADHGFLKVLTVPGTDKILGVTIVAEHAGDIIAEYVTAMKFGLGLKKILGTIHIYPTFAEANKYVAGVWQKQNAPQKALKLLERFHEWRR